MLLLLFFVLVGAWIGARPADGGSSYALAHIVAPRVRNDAANSSALTALAQPPLQKDGKKKKGKKKKKKAVEEIKEPSPYEKWSLEK